MDGETSHKSYLFLPKCDSCFEEQIVSLINEPHAASFVTNVRMHGGQLRPLFSPLACPIASSLAELIRSLTHNLTPRLVGMLKP